MEYMANTNVEINPVLFFVPDDVIDVRPSTGEDYPDIPEEPTEVDPETGIDIEYVDPNDMVSDSNPDEYEDLQTPQWLTVLSQTIRIAPDGRSVVDVILEVEEVMGAEEYELRVTKV
jgi:hypothetical protein